MGFAIEMPLTVGWGECDGLGIIYYPNYFDWFDQATWNFFEVLGMPLETMEKRYGILGLPLMSAQAKFRTPIRYREKLVVRTEILKVEKKIFEMEHQIFKGETLAVIGGETRFWGKPHPEDPKRLQTEDIPLEFMQELAQQMEQHQSLLAGT